MQDEDRKLSNRIIDYLRKETQRVRAEWTPDGWRSGNYSIAVEVNRIATALGVAPKAVNGALGHLHAERKVRGLRVEREKDREWLYAITLVE